MPRLMHFQHAAGLKFAITLLITTLALTACTGGSHDTGAPEDHSVRRGSY